MRKLKNAGVVLCLITCFAMLTGVSGCDDQMQDIQNWVENTNKLRATTSKPASTRRILSKKNV